MGLYIFPLVPILEYIVPLKHRQIRGFGEYFEGSWQIFHFWAIQVVNLRHSSCSRIFSFLNSKGTILNLFLFLANVLSTLIIIEKKCNKGTFGTDDC